VKSALPCSKCAGRGIVEVPESEGRGAGLYRICAVCHNSAGIRAPLSTAPTPTLHAADVSGQPREARKSGAPGASVDFGPSAISKGRAAFQKACETRDGAYAKLVELAEADRIVARDVGPFARERALSRILKSAEGKRLYSEYNDAANDAARSY